MKQIEDITEALEAILDSSKLELVVRALGEICHAKAEHLYCNWQDKALAAHWKQAGDKLTGVSVNHLIARVP
jgi:hypothetical protein